MKEVMTKEKTDVARPNLVVAKRLLAYAKNPKSVPHTLNFDGVFHISGYDFREYESFNLLESLSALDRRKIVSFLNRAEHEQYRLDERKNTNLPPFQLRLDKGLLADFIEAASDEHYGLPLETLAGLETVFAVLRIIKETPNSEYRGWRVEDLWLVKKLEETAEWLADYAELFTIKYAPSPVLAFSDGTYAEDRYIFRPISIEVADDETLAEFSESVSSRLDKMHDDLMPKEVVGTWRCHTCGAKLLEVSDREGAKPWLKNFLVGIYKPCAKCSSLNRFTVSSRGTLTTHSMRARVEKLTRSQSSSKMKPAP